MRDSVFFPLNCCGLRIPSYALRHWRRVMAAMQSQSVNPSVGSGDVDAAAGSFNDVVIHGDQVEVLVSGRQVGW